MLNRRTLLGAGAAALAAAGIPAAALAADDVIKVGNTMAYSGPASAYGQIGSTIGAYIEMVNAQGGVNGRKIEWISYDDGYSPPKTVEQIRRLVEQDEVDLLHATLGTPTNTAIHKYVNAKKVPHLFVATGASKWNDPENFPWTSGWQPNYPTEGAIYAQWILANIENPKIAVLYQNDDYGKDYLTGLKRGLAGREDVIVAEAPYEVAQPTVDSEVINLKASGANVFFIVATPKFAAQAIKKSAEIGWEAERFLNNVSISVGSVLQPAGLEASKGLISAGYLMEVDDPQWADHEEVAEWRRFMNEWYPAGDQTSSFTVYGYASAYTLVETLKRCGDDFSRENIVRQAASLKGLRAPLLLPGITINTSATDHAPIEAMQLMRFNGESWERFGEVVHAESS
ncbi:ABC transporter substrate-binding protein [Albimonas pacifica]|uniref:Amino acid/amide ABC transporter substrate-binding protein, HAAT family n=1 Tax=Albimonas pacifica TaxID=1114924 RepID=A0A1I3JRT0_9RHOB|nr:ABC transporter substrate-binding protein [Albimonas pacifica]SFI62923.1 amino acid/amide ABC transporter substrate-binding protein, HAAT family [Albimonas pacifica]